MFSDDLIFFKRIRMMPNKNSALNYIKIPDRGQSITVPALQVSDRTIIATGKWIRTAAVLDEMAVQGQSVRDPEAFVARLKESELKADLFTFAQQLPEITPKFSYPFAWDNVAAIRITSFQDWWENRLPQESRKNARRAAKRGVVVRVVPFDDELVRGIHKIYNETPMRQGKRFWHFGKDFDTVKRELATYLDRSEFIGAYCNEELIGFLKMVHVNRTGTLFHILSMDQHRDKRAMNALVAKAVELCEERKLSHFIYGQFIYGNKNQSSLAEFKRRNGFEQIDFPRYYIPLTAEGKIFVRLRLYKGIDGLLPEPILQAFLNCRTWCYKMLLGKQDGAQLQRIPEETTERKNKPLEKQDMANRP